jgi:hypothetical protein
MNKPVAWSDCLCLASLGLSRQIGIWFLLFRNRLFKAVQTNSREPVGVSEHLASLSTQNALSWALSGIRKRGGLDCAMVAPIQRASPEPGSRCSEGLTPTERAASPTARQGVDSGTFAGIS